MATAVKKLDLEIGELVEVGGRRYEVVPDREGGLTLEPPITPIAELVCPARNWKPASAEDFERLTAGDCHRWRGLRPDRSGLTLQLDGLR